MKFYFTSQSTSFATIAILVGLFSFGGCKKQPVSVAVNNGPDASSTIPQDAAQTPSVSPLVGLAAAIDVSETNIYDPAAADEKFLGTNLEALQVQVEAGDPDAMAELGRRYETGTGTNVDYKIAAKWYHLAAEKQNINAMVRLGLMHQQGRGVRIDARQSAMWFRAASDKNHPLAMARLGRLYLDGIGVDRNPESAVALLRKAAELGEPDAMLEIAGILESGIVGVQDFEEASRLRSKAKELMETAAAAKNLRALRWLADWAISFEQDQPGFDEALRWLLRASELGDTIAMVSLANLLAQNSLDPQKQAEAIAWCTKAADKLEPAALLLLADFLDRGFGVPQDDRQAFELRKQSAERGDLRGMRLCAEMLIEGRGTKAQPDLGLRWYQLAAGMGDGPSMAQVGVSFSEGRGCKKNEALAVAYFTRGAAQDDPESLFQLAACRESGSGVPLDLIAAAHGYQRSAGLGHREAMFHLAELLSRSDNSLQAVATDAVRWYELAALKGHSGAAEKLAQMYAVGDRVEQNENLAAAWKARVDAPPILAEDGVSRPPANLDSETAWGTLTAPQGDGVILVEGDTLSLTLKKAWDRAATAPDGATPESSADVENRNVPRIMQEANGDFMAEVTLPGPINWDGLEKDSSEPTPAPGLAGLLIWQDEENYVRLERVGALEGDRIQYTCDVTVVNNRERVFHAAKPLSKPEVRLRLARSSNRLRASITLDGGQSWQNFRSQEMNLDTAIKIGIVAFNASDKPVVVKFREFKLSNSE